MSDDEAPKAEIERAIPFPKPWSDSRLAAPNICLRSALFGVSKRGKRRVLDDEALASVKGFTILYKGERLDQYDFDVWATALHHQREFGFGVTAPISVSGIAKATGLDGSGKSLERVRKSLRRMLDGTVVLQYPGGGFAGHLISSFRWRNATDDGADGDASYVLKLDPELARMFERDRYTLIDSGERRALGDHYLAKWVHGYVRSHAAMWPIKVKTLRKLCGSEAAELYHFRSDLRAALDLLQERGMIVGWEIDDNDCVEILHTPSPVQARHLKRRGPRPGKTPINPRENADKPPGKTPINSQTTPRDNADDPPGKTPMVPGTQPSKPRDLTEAPPGPDRATPHKASEPINEPKLNAWSAIRGFFKI